MSNPYDPPSADVRVPHAERGSGVKAVALGLAFDILGSLVVGIAVVFAVSVWMAARGATAQDIDRALAIDMGSGFWWSATALGLAFSAGGGYLCARVARHAEMRFGAVQAAIAAVLGALLGGSSMPFAEHLVAAAATVLGTLLGAHAGARRNAGE